MTFAEKIEQLEALLSRLKTFDIQDDKLESLDSDVEDYLVWAESHLDSLLYALEYDKI